MSKKTNAELVAYCIAQIGRPYWLGGFGQAASKDLYNQNKTRLQYGPWEGDYEKAVGQKVHDCCGLVKGFVWTDGPNIPYKAGQYQSNGMGDWGVPDQYEKCTKKGSISNMPELPGLLLFNDKMSHMGVYIGNGEVIEARGHAYGVQRNKIKDRTFTKWGRLDCVIDYIEEKTGYKGYVQTFQSWLNKVYGFGLTVDGGCGPLTKKAAVKAVQHELNKLGEKLAVDGSCGPKTKAAMTRHMVQKGTKGNLAYIIQGLLYGAGYDCNGFDGSVGAGCDAAIRLCQQNNKLTVDGKVGGETLSMLVS